MVPRVKRSSSRKRKQNAQAGREQLPRWLGLRFDRRGLIADRWPIYALALTSWLLSLPLFEPWSWWPLGYVVFVPWLVAVCGARRSVHVHLASALLGALYFLIHLHWLCSVTLEGYVAASLYLGSYFVVASWLVRHLYRRRGVKAVIAFPVVWIAVELLRSHGPLSFPWFLLGHSQIHVPTMIQIADLCGAFGVSFVLAAVNGWIVDLKLAVLPIMRTKQGTLPLAVWRGAGMVLVLVAATVVYGRYRLATQELIEGPRIAVIQGDFLLVASRDVEGVPDEEKEKAYMGLIDKAARTRPDMYVLPETPWTMYLNPQMRAEYPLCEDLHQEFRQRVEAYDAFLTVGAMAEEPQPPGMYPVSHKYNSAYVYAPGVPEPARYDKIHLVPFGEFVPFRYTKGLFWLYRWLNDSDFNCWGRGGFEYSLTPGKAYTTFKMHPRGRKQPEYRFGVTICYEDGNPHLFRRFVAGEDGNKRVDFMLNISNDGWFGHGPQQPQHLVNCAFRAVENRVAIARAVNTGVSGFIRPDGVWYDVTGNSQRHPAAGGITTRIASLLLDERVSFYSRHGDVLAMACGAMTLLVLVDAVARRARRRRAALAAAGRKATS